jgi:hypothetical protein
MRPDTAETRERRGKDNGELGLPGFSRAILD